MSEKFNRVSADAFNNFQFNAGMVLNKFTSGSAIADEDIVCATTGGIAVTITPTFTDFGEDVDNVPNNTLELKRLQSYECKIAFTALDMTEETLVMSLGAADVTGSKIIPRHDLKADDFKDVYWVGERMDGAAILVTLKNALSTGGLSIQSEKDNKGNLTVELTGHYSIADVDEVPCTIEIIEG